MIPADLLPGVVSDLATRTAEHRGAPMPPVNRTPLDQAVHNMRAAHQEAYDHEWSASIELSELGPVLDEYDRRGEKLAAIADMWDRLGDVLPRELSAELAMHLFVLPPAAATDDDVRRGQEIAADLSK